MAEGKIKKSKHFNEDIDNADLLIFGKRYILEWDRDVSHISITEYIEDEVDFIETYDFQEIE